MRDRVRALRASGMSSSRRRGARWRAELGVSEAVGLPSRAGDRSGRDQERRMTRIAYVRRASLSSVAMRSPAGRRASAAADSHHCAPPVRRRRRLVRESVEPAQSARGDSSADVAPGRQDRSARHADGRQAVGLSVHPRHRPRQHQVQRRRGRCGCASICSAAAFCTSTTTTGSTRASVARSSASSPIGRSLTSR